MRVNKPLINVMICSLLLLSWADYSAADVNQIKKQIGKKQGKNVTIELDDQSKWKGTVISVNEDDFQLRAKNGETKHLQYADVHKVQSGLSKGQKILLFTGVGVAVFAVAVAYELNHMKLGDIDILNGL
jgi:hypothetical protein